MTHTRAMVFTPVRPGRVVLAVLRGSHPGTTTGWFDRCRALLCAPLLRVLVCAALAMLTTHTLAATVRPGGPEIRAVSAIVNDDLNEQVVYERSPDRPQPIASITKLMLAMVVLDAKLDPLERITIMEADKSLVRFSTSRLPVGTIATREDLLLLALMASENRAALALARSYPGGAVAAIAAMNAKAQALGLNQTRFSDPAGLDSGNVSTARDLAQVVHAALRYQTIRDDTTQHQFDLHTARGVIRFGNTDGLLKRREWNIDLTKTGFINEAGRCLVLHARIAGRPTTIVLLGAQGHYTALADAIRVRQWLESPHGRVSSAQ